MRTATFVAVLSYPDPPCENFTVRVPHHDVFVTDADLMKAIELAKDALRLKHANGQLDMRFYDCQKITHSNNETGFILTVCFE